MINTKEIKKLLIDKNLKIHDVAICIGRTYANTSLKLNGKLSLKLSEAEKIQELLGIADCDFCFYFLNGEYRL